jgi:hypothetical protein
LNGLNALFICVYLPIGQSWINSNCLMFFVVCCASDDAGHAGRRQARDITTVGVVASLAIRAATFPLLRLITGPKVPAISVFLTRPSS